MCGLLARAEGKEQQEAHSLVKTAACAQGGLYRMCTQRMLAKARGGKEQQAHTRG